MTPVVFALLLLLELVSNVTCFRQSRAFGEGVSQLIASSLGSTGKATAPFVSASGKGSHELAEGTSHGASFLSKEEPEEEEEEDDECPDSKMPKDSAEWYDMLEKVTKERSENKAGEDAPFTKLFFACLHDAEDYVKFFNVKTMLAAMKEGWKLDEVKTDRSGEWVGYYFNRSEHDPRAKHFMVAAVKEGKETKRIVFPFEGNYKKGALPEGTNCPKWSNASTTSDMLCEFYEVLEDDLVCIQGYEAFDAKKCADHAANTIVFFANEEGLETEAGPVGAEFGDVDGENTAYCGFGGKITSLEWWDDRDDKDMPLFATAKTGEDKSVTNMQCLMVACEEAEGKVPYDYWYKCRFNLNKYISFPIVLAFLLFWFLLMGVIADCYLVPALVKIGRGLRMSDALLGATLLALGGAANDFMVGLASALAEVKAANKADPGEDRDVESVKLWLGGVFGTGFFINTFVAALVMIFAPAGGIPVIPAVITRDICFRIFAVTMMIVFGQIKEIRWYGASLMIAVYLVYVCLTLREASARKATNPVASNVEEETSTAGGSSARLSVSRASAASFSHHGKLEGATPAPAVEATASFAGEEDIGDRIKRHMGYDPDGGVMDKAGFIAALPVRWAFALTMATNTWDPIVSPLMPLCISFFIPFASYGLMVAVTDKEELMANIFWWEVGVFVAVGAFLSGAIFYFQMKAGQKRSIKYIAPSAYAWITFVTCVLWLALVANEVLDCLTVIADIFDIPTMVAGMTMLAWGNCVDNVFATIGLAKAGEFGVAITGIYAAPMFNVLFGTGITLLMITVLKNDKMSDFPMENSAILMLCTLLVILACTLLFTKLNGWKMTRLLGAVLAILYPTVLIVAFTLGDSILSVTPLYIVPDN